MAGDVAAVMDASGIERAAIVDATLGSMIAQELAQARPEPVERLVLACTTPRGQTAATRHPSGRPGCSPAAQTSRCAGASKRSLVADGDRAPTARGAGARGAALASQPPAGWSAQAAASAGFDVFDRLESIAAPTLVLHGTDDAVVDHRNADVLAQRIPDARLELFPGAGHLLFWEEPERFVSLVAGILGKGTK